MRLQAIQDNILTDPSVLGDLDTVQQAVTVLILFVRFQVVVLVCLSLASHKTGLMTHPTPLLQCFSDYNESPLLGAWNTYSSDSMDWPHRQPSLPPQVPLPPARLVGQGGGGERSQRVHGRQLAAGAQGD